MTKEGAVCLAWCEAIAIRPSLPPPLRGNTGQLPPRLRCSVQAREPTRKTDRTAAAYKLTARLLGEATGIPLGRLGKA